MAGGHHRLYTLCTHGTSCEPGNPHEAGGRSLFINMESEAHLDAWVETGCPGESTGLKEASTEWSHGDSGSALGLCDATAPLLHQASCYDPALALWWSGL